MNVRNLEQRLERLEHAILPCNESIPIIVVEYVPHGTLKGFKNDRGFYSTRLSGESEQDCLRRAQELVRMHVPSTPGPHCGILLLPDCEKATQQDWEEQAPTVAPYRSESPPR
jgi:hypothetical protein